MKKLHLLTAFTLTCLVVACGGGGGDSENVDLTPTSAPIDPLSGVLMLSAPLSFTWTSINGIPVRTPTGTSAYGATLTVGTQTRRYVVIRPNPKPVTAPLLMILHPRDTAPELTANFTHAADFVATQGIWAVLPEAVGAKWKGEPLEGEDDKLFLAALMDTLVADGVDATRITVAGYSSGGVMAQRLACEMADRIAAFGVVATTLPLSLWVSCAPSEPRPKVYILGTDDPYAPYDGVAGLGSAAGLMDYWAEQQGCTGVVSQAVPDIADDGTTVLRDEHTGCTGGRGLRLYTVQNGEHAWPDPAADPDYVGYAGRTSRDMSATGAIWSYARSFRR
ncbi:MAG: alpha/beta hydrolase family esterase [Panacagrimonas sp.]